MMTDQVAVHFVHCVQRTWVLCKTDKSALKRLKLNIIETILDNSSTCFLLYILLYMSVAIFWVMTPCGLVGGYQRFGRTYCFHH
jgi:hypothetical protein